MSVTCKQSTEFSDNDKWIHVIIVQTPGDEVSAVYVCVGVTEFQLILSINN